MNYLRRCNETAAQHRARIDGQIARNNARIARETPAERQARQDRNAVSHQLGRAVPQGGFTLAMAPGTPSDNYFNSFDKHPIAAKVFYICVCFSLYIYIYIYIVLICAIFTGFLSSS
jgi:hypothetical protein